MAKVCIIGLQNLYQMQFLYKYTDILDAQDIDYDVLYWDRTPDHPVAYKPFQGKKVAFKFPMSNYQPKYKKIKGYLKCMAFVCRHLRENPYEKLILLITQTVLPVYCMNRSVRKGSYLYDYRDITFEKIPLCRKLICKIIQDSCLTAISSEGFKEVLGNNEKMVMSHNTSNLHYEPITKHPAERIRIRYWGIVRQTAFHKKVCDLFGNDDRFDLCYHGECESDELERYCREKKYRVRFTGRYTTDQIPSFVADTDILLNLYENDKIQRLATTVKLYDGIRYGLPMLISKGSHMEKLMQGNSAVCCLDVENASLETVFQWYKGLQNQYPYPKELEQIQKDDQLFREKLLDFLRK